MPRIAFMSYSPILIFLAMLDVDFLIDLIQKQRDKVFTYELPKDASRFKPHSDDFEKYGTYDFIIVGAGAAGAIIASRLSEIPHWNVLLVEAGDFENNVTNIPAMALATTFSDYNWAYSSIPQKTACLGFVERRCPYARGRAVGGSTVINTLVYTRGNKIDYDKWAEEGNPGWSYEEVLPYFVKSENSEIEGDHGYHTKGGPLNVEFFKSSSPQLYSFLKANVELGRKVLDYNGRQQLGVSPTQINTINGQRLSTGRAFVNPALGRNNLHVLTESYVTNILVNKENKSAWGVAFTLDGKSFVAEASLEVILSAGSISSPQLLMLSGIGPKEHLQSLDIEVVKDLPVGEQLFDHPAYLGLNFETNQSEPQTDLKTQVEEFLNGKGPLAIAGNSQGIGFFQALSKEQPDYPDVELLLIPSPNYSEELRKAFQLTNETAGSIWGQSDPNRSFSLYVLGSHAKSKGSIKLKSKSPFEYPLIDSDLLSDPHDEDIKTLHAGIKLAMQLLDTKALRKIDAKLAAKPFKACKDHKYLSEAYWYCAIRQAAINFFHPVGSCRMGPGHSDGSVVDHRLKVHGIGNLRVADASVIPFSIAAHTSAPTMMIGEKAADIIKRQYL